MTNPPPLEFSHVGIFVADISAMQSFYTRVLGFPVTDRGKLDGCEIVFLSRDAREHHQIVLVAGRPSRLDFNIVNQISLRAGSLSALCDYFSLLQAERVSGLVSVTHGVSWSVYFLDPEGNRIEIFTDTPWYVDQPHREPIDLSRPVAEIMADTENRIKNHPSFRAISAWREDFRKSLGRPSDADKSG